MQLDAAVQRVEQQESELEQIQAQIAETKQRIADAEVRYEQIRERLNERAAQAFMSVPGTGLEFVLGATSLSDLSDRMEFVDVVAQTDAGLAQEVANLEAELQIQENDLEKLEADQKAEGRRGQGGARHHRDAPPDAELSSATRRSRSSRPRSPSTRTCRASGSNTCAISRSRRPQ